MTRQLRLHQRRAPLVRRVVSLLGSSALALGLCVPAAMASSSDDAAGTDPSAPSPTASATSETPPDTLPPATLADPPPPPQEPPVFSVSRVSPAPSVAASATDTGDDADITRDASAPIPLGVSQAVGTDTEPSQAQGSQPTGSQTGRAPVVPTTGPAVDGASDGANTSNAVSTGPVALASGAASMLRGATPREGGSPTPGIVEVSFTVYMDGKQVDDQAQVVFECRGEDAPPPKTVIVEGDGTPVILANDVPAGQECRVSASLPPALPYFQINVTDNEEWVATSSGPEHTRHTIRLDVTTRMTTASVAVRLVGVTGDHSEHPFIINYSCYGPFNGTKQLSGTVTVKGDGVPVTLPDKIPATLNCYFSEDPTSARLPGHTLNPVDDQLFEAYSMHHSEPVVFINNYSREKNTFQVAVNATGSAIVPSDEYIVHYSCDNGQINTIKVKGDRVPVQASVDFPVGTVCNLWLQEHDVAGWFAPRPEHVRLEITNTPRPLPVVFDYKFSRETRPFKITSSFEGLPPWAFVTPTYTITCDNGLTWTEKVRYLDYPTRTVRSAPIGATCTVAPDPSSGALDGYTLTPPPSQRVTIPAANTDEPTLEFTFSYAPVPSQADTGTFTVTKESTGAKTESKMFTFTYDCGPGHQGTLRVPGDGSVTPSKVLVPVGATCTVSEDLSSAQIEGYTLIAPRAQTLTISTTGEVVSLTFTNIYTKEMNPAPSVTPPSKVTPPKMTKKQSLAATGADMTTLLTAFGGLIATAAAFIVLRKRWR